MNIPSDTPERLARLADDAEASGGALLIYRNDTIVFANEPARGIYRTHDWAGTVTFDNCFRRALEQRRIDDPVILADPEAHLMFAKAARHRGESFHFRRRYDGAYFDRYHIGHDRTWDAQIWFPATSESMGAVVLEAAGAVEGLEERLGREKAAARALDALEGMGIAVAVVSAEGRVIDRSPMMADLIASGVPVMCDDDGIVITADPDSTRILHRAIGMVAEGDDRAVVVPVRGIGSDTPEHVGVLAVHGPEPVALMVIARFPQPEDLSRVLTTAYGLGAREAEVAARLAGGCAPEDIARDTGRSVNTIRAQIKALRPKITDCPQHGLAHVITRAAVLVGGVGFLQTHNPGSTR